MNTDARFDQLIADGLAASQQGRVDEALALFGDAAALVPASGIPHFLIADELASGRLEILFPQSILSVGAYYLVYP